MSLTRLGWWPALVLLLAAPPSKAAEMDPELKAQLVSAEHAYDELDYEQALEQVHAARRLAKTPEELVRVGLFEGVLLSVLHHPDEAQAAFESALLRSPRAALPLKVSPTISAQFEALRRRVQEEQRAQRAAKPSLAAPPSHAHAERARERASRPAASPPASNFPSDAPVRPSEATAIPRADAPTPFEPPRSNLAAAPTAPRGPRSRLPAYLLLGAAGGLGATAAVLIVQGHRYDREKAGLTFNDAQALRRRSVAELTAGTVLGACAGAAAVWGLGWLWQHRAPAVPGGASP